MNTTDRVRHIIADRLCVDLAEVTDEANIHDDLHADSLDAVDLMMEIEHELNIIIPDEKAETMKTVKQIIDYVLYLTHCQEATIIKQQTK